jgi:hypothetical protein
MRSWANRTAAPFVLAVLATAAPAGADYLTGVTMSVGPGGTVNGVGVANPMVPPPGNFNSGLNNTNTVTVSKTFMASLQPIDIVFNVAASNPAQTEYLFNETISNRTGATWTDFHWQLGFGSGANFVLAPAKTISFNLNNAEPEGIELTPSGAFETKTFSANDIAASTVNGPGVPNNTSLLAAFAIDIPTGLNRAQLTLREFATPEPPSLLLTGVGAAAALLLRVRRRAGPRSDGAHYADRAAQAGAPEAGVGETTPPPNNRKINS